ncbi:hypothetical protein VM1G_07852 [Cytospora mali]|uniref:Inheritance of peroxisomes protein 1 n=1 Tax=Cytospora mali TaxID=578113 RepID=A0A194W6K3_CYTMA|nr:hypothetical protein VM1G_07852 [Valsa mali]
MDRLRPPGTAVPFPAPRRHSTVPTTFQPTTPRPAPEPVANGSLETLYNHPSVKIVAFTAGKPATDRLGPALDEIPGTLPSSSQIERTIAVGAFQIYRAPGSVAFLRCGSALQPILPKSQCWCLDEKSSKFALQIRRPNYWRIEVPSVDDEDIRRALVLREILDKIMQFEKTPCPFERNFTVELPERPTTPVKKRPWTPPVRTVSMNWPPVQQAVTSPPEFATRTRFYNPSARRHSDFGLDMSNMSFAPATPETKPDGEGISDKKKSDAPTNPPSRRVSEMAFRPLPEEPEPLIPPLTAIAPELTRNAKDNLPQITAIIAPKVEPDEPRAASETPSLTIAQDIEQKQECILITKKPSLMIQNSKRPTIYNAQPTEHAVSTLSTATQFNDNRVDLHEAHTNTASPEMMMTPISSPVGTVQARKEAIDESENREGGTLEGTGEVQVRRTRLAAFASRRAATTPSLKLRTSSSPFNNVVENAPQETPQPGSPADSSDSFHSTESWHSPIEPPSPPLSPSRTYPFPHENIPLTRVHQERRASDYEATPTAAVWERNSTGAVAGSGQNTPITPFTNMGMVVETSEETETEPKPSTEAMLAIPINGKLDTEEHATTDTDSLSTSWSSAASRTSSPNVNPLQHCPSTTSVSISHSTSRSLSPLPPPATLFTPRAGGALRRLPSTAELQVRASTAVKTIRRIPSAILNKTCEIFFSPPAHMIALMLKVAARIAAGEWRGFVFGMGEGGEVVDVRWDWSDEHGDLDEGAALEGWSEADIDFTGNGGQGLRPRRQGRRARASFTAADLSRPRGKILEYQDPWATSPEDLEPGRAEDDDPSRSWGVD